MSRFEVLVRGWSAETRFMSSVQDMVLNVHYQKVIALGPDVVPLILRRLKSSPEHWFFALHVLTGASPIKPADRGNLLRMAAAWIAWGQENGMID